MAPKMYGEGFTKAVLSDLQGAQSLEQPLEPFPFWSSTQMKMGCDKSVPGQSQPLCSPT